MKRSELIKNYVDTGKLSQRRLEKNGETYEIYCYTKDAFFASDWDETLITHRGAIYRLNPGTRLFQPINNPIPKIFNVGEHESCDMDTLVELMKTNEYEVLDKVNGHLVIVSPDASTGFKNVLVSTKGGFEGFDGKDEDLLHKMGVLRTIKRLSLNYTFMFECVAEYDKHVWYESDKAKYGGLDTMVLLAAVDNNTSKDLSHEELKQLAFVIGSPVVKKYENLYDVPVEKWYEHKDLEGYVINFPGKSFRVKVKTKAHIFLRYFKQITTEKLVTALYNSGMENLYREYDEEMYPILDALKMDSFEYLLDSCIDNVVGTAVEYGDKKAIASNKDLNEFERQYLFGVKDGIFPSEILERIASSKRFRTAFKERGSYMNTEEAIKKMFGQKSALLGKPETV